jgi:small subunit ribosomal protein S16
MLTIRLTRVGKKGQPLYRFIISEKARDPWGKALEILGTYNPRTKPASVTLEKERVQYWISKGAQCSDTVYNILIDQGVITDKKRAHSQISVRHKERMEKKVKA